MNDKIYITNVEGNLIEYDVDDVYGDIPNFSNEENNILENLNIEDETWFEEGDIYIRDEYGFLVKYN